MWKCIKEIQNPEKDEDTITAVVEKLTGTKVNAAHPRVRRHEVVPLKPKMDDNM